MRINIYIENTYSDTEPKVYTEKGKLEAIQQMAQKIREDANWVNDTLYSRYHHNELYEKMLTEKGREEVEYFLQCAVSPAYRRKWIQQYNEQYNERHKGSAPQGEYRIGKNWKEN